LGCILDLPVDASAAFVASAICVMFWLMLPTASAADCMFDEMSRATAFCCSAALAIAAEIWLMWLIVALIVPKSG
jgi:hypothetical protein